MHQKKWLIMSVAVVVLIAAVCVVCWYLSSGVHFLLGTVNLDLEDVDCYIVDRQMETVTDRTELTLKGRDDAGSDMISDGEFCVRGYIDSTSCDIGFMKDDDGWSGVFRVYDDQRSEDTIWTDDEETLAVGTVRFAGDVPVFSIGYEDGREDVYAVPADSEEDALRLVQEAFG